MEVINQNTGYIFDLIQDSGEGEYTFFNESTPIPGYFIQAEKEVDGWSALLLMVANDGGRSAVFLPGDGFDTLDECLEALEEHLDVDYWQAPQPLGF